MTVSATPTPWMQRLLEARWLVPLGLSLPAVPLLLRAMSGPWDDDRFYALMHGSGEFSVRWLVLALLATPLQKIWPRARAVKWLRRHRRAFGVAAFGYAALHLAFYLKHCWGGIIDDLSQWTYLAGWLALLMMVPLAATSLDAAVKALGLQRWRKLHRLAYAVAVMTALHWLTKSQGSVVLPVLLYFGPLALLQLYRVRARRPKPR